MKDVIEFTDKPQKGQTWRVGKLNCQHCKTYSMNVIIPIDKKSFERFDEHVHACQDLIRLEKIDSSLKTPEILDQIKKNKENITRGYN
jgi:hypothetical protein